MLNTGLQIWYMVLIWYHYSVIKLIYTVNATSSAESHIELKHVSFITCTHWHVWKMNKMILKQNKMNRRLLLRWLSPPLHQMPMELVDIWYTLALLSYIWLYREVMQCKRWNGTVTYFSKSNEAIFWTEQNQKKWALLPSAFIFLLLLSNCCFPVRGCE